MQLTANHKIPVIIVTGFLGAGKTTLLNRLLKTSFFDDSGFIINEFGAVGIDDLLVETADENMVALMNGCLCCTIKGDLPDTLVNLLERSQQNAAQNQTPLQRIIIETTGLANPLPIIQSILGTPFLQPYLSLEQVITVMDLSQGLHNLANYNEAVQQIISADKIVISKTDLADGQTAFNKLTDKLDNMQISGQILTPPLSDDKTEFEQFAKQLLSQNFLKQGAETPSRLQYEACHAKDKHSHEHEHEHEHEHDISRHGKIKTFTLTAHNPVPFYKVEQFIFMLAETYGQQILRLKGIIKTSAKSDDYWLVQGVQGQYFPPQHFTTNQEQQITAKNLKTQLVIIVDNLDEAEIQKLWDACTDIPSIDSADRTAITDNPLAIPGFKL